MAEPRPLGVAIIGCGNISRAYASALGGCGEQLRLIGSFDLVRSRAEELSREFGGRVYDSFDDVLTDAAVDLVLNLTIHQAHAEVISRALEAGKHVHTEKPLALDPVEAKKLVALAKKRRRRLSCAPTTFMGEAQQTAWKLVRQGMLGTVRVVYCEMNWGRIETWHPNPAPFYEVGAMYDVGVYPLTVLTTIFGPVQLVRGYGQVVMPDRVTRSGQAFHVETPDWMCGLCQFESGQVLRITASFYVGATKQEGIEIHGDAGSLILGSAANFEADVLLRTDGQWQKQPPVREPYKGVDWSRGLIDLYEALRDNRPHRASAEQAAHVIETIAGIHKSAQTGRPVTIRSRFEPPAPMEWAS